MLKLLTRTESGHFTDVAREELPGLLTAPETLVWVDLEAPSDDEVAVLSEVFHFHPLTIDDCLNRHVDPAKVDDYGSYLFIVAQGVSFDSGQESVETAELDLYVGCSYVVSFHDQPLPSVKETHGRCTRAAPLPAKGADWLAHALLDSLVDAVLPVVEAMDEEIAALEDRALDHPGRELVERITTLKRGTLRLRRLVAPQRDVVNRLSRGDFQHIIRPETAMYFRDIYDHLVRLEDMVEGLRDLGDSVIATYLATVNNRMNEVMKALSIVGTIFLPLTLLASVFGTNFAPTYEDWGWPGFLLMCLVMVVSAGALLSLFRRRGWL